MIIRMTMHDNDFNWTIMNPFMDVLTRKMNHIEVKNPELANILNSNSSDCTLSDEEKEEIENITLKLFKNFLQGLYNNKKITESDFDYFVESIKITVVDAMIDQWENGEAYYWFQHSNGKYIVL